MKTLPGILVFVLLLSLFPLAGECAHSCFTGGSFPSQRARLEVYQQRTEVPFKLYRGYAIVARGSVGNLGNLKFIIDTGAAPTVFDQRLARKLHLEHQKLDLSVFTKSVQTQQAIAPSIRIGPLDVNGLRVMVQDLAFVKDALGTSIDAMIGFDVLGQTPFTIDYEVKKIVFGSIDPSLRTVSYHPVLPYVIVDLEIGDRTLAILLDTGASDLVLFRSSIQNSPSFIRAASEGSGNVTWSNMGGELQVKAGELTQGRIGSISLIGTKVYILEGDTQRIGGLAGLAGAAALKARRLAFDPQRKVIAWE